MAGNSFPFPSQNRTLAVKHKKGGGNSFSYLWHNCLPPPFSAISGRQYFYAANDSPKRGNAISRQITLKLNTEGPHLAAREKSGPDLFIQYEVRGGQSQQARETESYYCFLVLML